MYCSTCGGRVPPGRTRCDTCGAAIAPRVDLAPRPREASSPVAGAAWAPAPVLRNCPRCGYRGEGVGYFSRGSHMAGLVVATVVTAGAMGAGGLVYYLLRRDHEVCPRCGRGWGRNGERALVRAGTAAPTTPAETGLAPGRESPAWGFSVLLFMMAAILMVVGIVDFEAVPFLLGMVAAGGAFTLQRSARRAREERRAALISSLQLPVLKLAADRGGRLTVTEVAAALGWTLPRSEKVLMSLDDGIRVDSEVTDEGVIVYHFRELPGKRD